MKEKRYHNIELLRIIFTLTIIYFHILHSNILEYVGGNGIYYLLGDLCRNSTLIVECFFIISGYFLFQSYVKQPNILFLQFVLKKVFRLLPVLLFSLVIGIIFFQEKIFPAIFNGLFLQCIGISLEYKGINWYISPLFWTLVFYFSLLKFFNPKKINVLIAIIVYVCYAVLINNEFGREVIFGFLNLGLLRALAGVGCGYLIGLGISETKNIKIENWERNFKKIEYVICSFFEIVILGYLFQYFLLGGNRNNPFIVVIVFSFLLTCFVAKKGIISQLFDKKVFSLLGRYTYSTYVMQQSAFYILQKTLWKTTIVNNVGLCIVVSMLFCIIVGILTYHLIECPCAKLYSKLEFNGKC